MNLPKRKKNRLPDYDYSQNGRYFITICVKNKREIFGLIKNNRMILNEFGKIVEKCWFDLPRHYENCFLDEFVIMPNHVHGIVVIENKNDARIVCVGNGFLGNGFVGNGFKPFPTKMSVNNSYHRVSSKPRKIHGLSEMIRAFKTFSSRRINEKIGAKFRWQKSFYDHIIRDEKSLFNIRRYIRDNPKNCGRDRNNLWNF